MGNRYQTRTQQMNNKEQRGIYNVTFNAKKATALRTDLETIEYGLAKYLNEKSILFSKGYHNIRTDSGFGAEHIKLHLDKESEGAISISELLNLGKYIREYLAIFKEPFIEKEGGRKIYEWQNDEDVRFRVVVDKIRGEGLDVPLSSSKDVIITYYSDRNATNKMLYKNPKVQDYYAKQQTQASESTLSAQSQNKIRRR